MFTYSAYAQQLQHRSFDELEALADDLEYRAAHARQAARRDAFQPVAYDERPQSTMYTYQHPLQRTTSRVSYLKPTELRRQRPQPFYEPEDVYEFTPVVAHRPRPASVYDQPYENVDALQYNPRPLYWQQLLRSDEAFEEDAVIEQQRARDIREARVYAAAERARSRAVAQRAAVEAGRRAQFEKERVVEELKRREQDKKDSDSRRALQSRQAQEIEAVLNLILGNRNEKVRKMRMFKSYFFPY